MPEGKGAWMRLQRVGMQQYNPHENLILTSNSFGDAWA